ncbi:MAG: hypothetical protein HY894_06920 [Deltaproteobacteria bacterium]|nr:hypothetical protein [Deltaproteobacteria bacterium]
MEIKDALAEYNSILNGLMERLEYLAGSGVRHYAPSKANGCGTCVHDGTDRVDGRGSLSAVLVFVKGAPMGGDAAITRMIEAMKFRVEEVYITHAVRCAGDEGVFEAVQSCKGLLEEEIKRIRPRAIAALGPAATEALLGSPDMERLRGRFHDYNGIKVMPTHDPDQPEEKRHLKRETWADMILVMKELGKTP